MGFPTPAGTGAPPVYGGGSRVRGAGPPPPPGPRAGRSVCFLLSSQGRAPGTLVRGLGTERWPPGPPPWQDAGCPPGSQDKALPCPLRWPRGRRTRPEAGHQPSLLAAGGWLLPSTSALCPPATPHPQFGGPLSLPPAHGCERYPALRSHRPAPYPSPYAHRDSSPSEWGPRRAGEGAPGGGEGSPGGTPSQAWAAKGSPLPSRPGALAQPA